MIQFVQQAILVQLQLADPFEGGLIGDQRIADSHAEVTQDGGVGQVALPAGNRQFAGQVLHDRIGQAEVAFGVFEVNRVHLVRHGGGADFPGDGLLFEVVERDVAPHIAIEVDQNGVEARDAVKQLSDVVMRLDLGGVRVPLNAQRGDELFAELMPVDFRVGRDVGVVVTHRAVDFTEDFHLVQLTILPLHTVGDVRHLFTHGGRRCRLTVGTGEQRHIAVLGCQIFYRVNQLAPVRQNHFVAGGFQHQRVGEVIDVFRRTGEVNKL